MSWVKLGISILGIIMTVENYNVYVGIHAIKKSNYMDWKENNERIPVGVITAFFEKVHAKI